MARVRRSVLLAFPAPAVYRLVADVQRYAEFLPWCVRSEVLESTEAEVLATLDVDIRGRREKLVTRNRLSADRAIDLQLVRGPFRRFEGGWRFTALGDDGCRVEVELAFELSSRLMSAFAAPFIERAADRVVDAFAARARAVLGPCASK